MLTLINMLSNVRCMCMYVIPRYYAINYFRGASCSASKWNLKIAENSVASYKENSCASNMVLT